MLRKFLKAGFGGVGAQLINLAALPIISRLYTPEEYAIWALVIATALIFGGIACLRYELALVLPEDNREASALFIWCIAASLTTAVLVSSGSAILLAGSGPDLISNSNLYHFTLLAPLLVAATGLTLALQYWAVRHESYTLNSLAQIVLAAATISCQVAYALFIERRASGLILGSLFGQVMAVLTLAVGILIGGNRPELSREILPDIVPAIKKHYRFPFYSMPYALFGTIRERASVYVLAAFVGPREVGLYAFAYRIMNFPVSLISAALRPVLFRETSTRGVAALEQAVNRILFWLAITATPLVVIYFYWAEDIFGLVFGDQWRGAAFYGKFAILPVFTFMFCNWMDRIMDVLGHQRLTMTLEIFFGSLSVLSLWLVFTADYGLVAALTVQSSALIAYNILYLVLAYDRAGYGRLALLKLLGIVVLTAILTLILVQTAIAY